MERISRKQSRNVAEERIKSFLFLDLGERIQALKTEYIKLYQDPKIDIQKGYIMHDFPIRPCDLVRIHNKRIKFDSPLKSSSRQATQIPGYSIAQRIVINAKEPGVRLDQNHNASMIAQLPAFYTKQQSVSRLKHPKIDQTVNIRIRSMSREGQTSAARTKTSAGNRIK